MKYAQHAVRHVLNPFSLQDTHNIFCAVLAFLNIPFPSRYTVSILVVSQIISAIVEREAISDQPQE